MKASLLILTVAGFLGAGCGVGGGHGSGLGHPPTGHPPTAKDVARAVRAASDWLELPAGERTSCHRTTSGTVGGNEYEAFHCTSAIQCDVEWGVETAGRPSDFYYCQRPTGDSFSYAEVCVVGSGGMIQVDADRTADRAEFSCPYSED